MNGRTAAAERTRLTIVVDSREYGGAEAYVAQLLRELPGRFETTLLAARPVPQLLDDAARGSGADIVGFDAARGKIDVAGLVNSARSLRATRPDLVHLNLVTVTNNRHLIGAAVALGLPAVATLHLVAPLQSRVQVRLLRPVYRRLRRFIAVSQETRTQLCSELGVERDAVVVVPNGVRPRAPIERAAATPVRIGAVGRLTKQKGFDVLLDAVRLLGADGREVEVVVAGEGPDRRALVAHADGLPVEFRGFVDDIPVFLDGLDLFCLPSRWEGLPFALLEAMMAGLPCVASDVGDVASALGSTGIVVPPEDPSALADALRALVSSPSRRRELGAAAHERALAGNTTERMIAETARVYDEALAR
jgi:glycosyltransferase involved in cell wall biosynthesis